VNIRLYSSVGTTRHYSVCHLAKENVEHLMFIGCYFVIIILL